MHQRNTWLSSSAYPPRENDLGKALSRPSASGQKPTECLVQVSSPPCLSSSPTHTPPSCHPKGYCGGRRKLLSKDTLKTRRGTAAKASVKPQPLSTCPEPHPSSPGLKLGVQSDKSSSESPKSRGFNGQLPVPRVHHGAGGTDWEEDVAGHYSQLHEPHIWAPD